MNWHLAIEKNRAALKRVLAMLIAMAEVSGGPSGTRAATLPRHLHRFLLSLLRPAESATRRLIIIAARGLVVKVLPPRTIRPRSKPEPATIYVLDRIGGSIVSVPMVLPKPPREPSPPRRPSLLLPLLDPPRRFGYRRRYVKAGAAPRILLLDGPYVSHRPAPPQPPSADDPVAAGRLHHRLDAIGFALDDLPGHAARLARWQARCDARSARERSQSEGRDTGNGNPPNEIHGGPAVARTELGAQRKPRYQRYYPMRSGRPPGWRRKPNHDVFEILNELHGLAVWARERPDTS